MKRNPWKLVLLLISVGILAGFWAAAQAPVPSRPLAEWMPDGALLYLESSDFTAQLRDWNRSKMKSEWLASKNHEHFMTTRLILKLKDVYGEFSNAAGFEPNLDELETIAGGETAIALYDIRRLDLLYISRLPSAKLGQNVLTRVRSGYETRGGAGRPYFARKAGERTAAFAVAGDYLVLSTREDLLSSALDLVGGTTGRSLSQEAWYRDSLQALPADLAGPAALRLVMDFANVIKTPYFRSYWIQRNTDELRNYSAVLSQVTRKADALEENRLLIRSQEAPVTAHESASVALQQYIPDGIGLFRLWDTASVDLAMDLIRRKFFGAGSRVPAARRNAPGVYAVGFAAPIGDLQTRIDEAPKPLLAGTLDLEPLKTLIESAGLEAVLHLESSVVMDGEVFVGSDAALAFRAASPWNAAAIRSALTAAVASYQSVGNAGLQWRNSTASGYTLSQWDGLMPMTTYIDGQTLWIARTPSLLGAALSHSASAAPRLEPSSYLARYVHRAELQPYLKFMRMLDLSDQSNYSNFFSENIGSLASVLDVIASISVRIDDTPLVQRQTVRYELAR